MVSIWNSTATTVAPALTMLPPNLAANSCAEPPSWNSAIRSSKSTSASKVSLNQSSASSM